MKKFIILVFISLFSIGTLLAEEAMKQGGEHPFSKPDATVANTIVWVSVAVVAVTLVLTLKYLFKPGEDNPDHIKNIVIDEGF